MAENKQNEQESQTQGTATATGGIVGAFNDFMGKIFGNKDEELDPSTMMTYGWDYSQDKTYIINTPDNKNDEPEVYTETQIDEMRKEIAAYDVEDELAKQGVKHDTIHDNDIYDFDAYEQAYASMKGGNYAKDNAKTAEDKQSLGQSYDPSNPVKELCPDDYFGSDEDHDRFTTKYGDGEHIVTTDGKESCFKANNRVFESPYDSGMNGMTSYGTRSKEEIDTMREIVAAADAIDGKGNYEDNLKELQSGDYRETQASEEDWEEIRSEENTIEPIPTEIPGLKLSNLDETDAYEHAGDTDNLKNNESEEENKNADNTDETSETSAEKSPVSSIAGKTGKLAMAAGVMKIAEQIEDKAFESDEAEEEAPDK